MESAEETFTLRSQLFRKKTKTFLPFKQQKMPPRADEWIGNLGDAPVPPTGDVGSLGSLQLEWGIRAMNRGSCPMLHTVCYNGRAQSAWDPMPKEMLVGYLEVIAEIPYSFQEIVEEYLPGVFDPIRRDDATGLPPSTRWYPKPILVAACIFAERRILSDPRTEQVSDDEYDTDDEESEGEDAFSSIGWPGANLVNRFARLDESDDESDTSESDSIFLRTSVSAPDGFMSNPYDSYSDSDEGSIFSADLGSDLDSVSTCSDDFESHPEVSKSSPHGNPGDSDDNSDESDDDSDDSNSWDVWDVNLDFQRAMDELVGRGLEFYSSL